MSFLFFFNLEFTQCKDLKDEQPLAMRPGISEKRRRKRLKAYKRAV